METMNNLLLLETTKASDRVPCSHCHKGYWVPSNPKAEYNSWFTCSHCGTNRHIERNVTVEQKKNNERTRVTFGPRVFLLRTDNDNC